MKKKIFPIVTILIFILPLINAASFDFANAKYQITRVIDSALGILSPFFEYIIGSYSTSEFFFVKILLLVLLILICKNILDRTPIGEENPKVSLIISVIISILAIRFMNENNFFEAILIQYGVLGIAITTILPMVIFFYFIHNTQIGTYGRKVFWTLYVIILTAIWIMKSTDIPEVANWIYVLTIFAAIIFIFFDKSIHSYFGQYDFNKYKKELNEKRMIRLQEDLYKLEDLLEKRIITQKKYNKELKRIKREQKEASRE